MKKQFILMGAVVLIGISSCSDTGSGSASGLDSTKTTTTTTTSNMTSTMDGRTFTDLKTGNKITVRRDTVTWTYVDVNNGKEIGIYFDPETHDTFDSRGYILNNALIDDSGNWTIEEDKLWENPENVKIKEGDMKLKINGDKMKMKTDSTKIKQDANSYKEKTDTSKIKITNKKTKVKEK